MDLCQELVNPREIGSTLVFWTSELARPQSAAHQQCGRTSVAPLGHRPSPELRYRQRARNSRIASPTDSSSKLHACVLNTRNGVFLRIWRSGIDNVVHEGALGGIIRCFLGPDWPDSGRFGMLGVCGLRQRSSRPWSTPRERWQRTV